MSPYFVYVLWSESGKRYYIGVTDDLKHRLSDHNTGISRWTKRYAGSWRLVWSRQFPSLGEARRFENKLKRQKGGRGFFRLLDIDSSGS